MFRGSDAVRQGLLTEHQLRSQAWVRLLQDVYADARLERDHGLMCRAAITRMPKGVVIAGPSAAWFHGIGFAAEFHHDVHVIAPPALRVGAQRMVRTHVTDLADDEVAGGSDPPYTSATRTACDVGAWLPLWRSVPILDAMVHQGVVSRADLDGLLVRFKGRWGRKVCRTAFGMADGACSEPSASYLRARLRLEGIPAPDLTFGVLFANATVVPDMAWPRYRVAVEYRTDQMYLLTAAGWLVVHAPPARVKKEFPAVLREVRQCLLRRGAHLPNGR